MFLVFGEKVRRKVVQMALAGSQGGPAKLRHKVPYVYGWVTRSGLIEVNDANPTAFDQDLTWLKVAVDERGRGRCEP